MTDILVPPATVLGLSGNDWKITLPIGPGKGQAKEYKGAEFETLTYAPYYLVALAGTSVIFEAPVSGVTTSGSNYPRSELNNDVANGGLFDSAKGLHSMTFEMSFNHLPLGKGVVGAQVHGKRDDVSTFRLEGKNLYITRSNNAHYFKIRSDYELGTVFNGGYVVEKKKLHCYYNGVQVLEMPIRGKGNYFKLGCYTQANQSYPGDYGQTEVHHVMAKHS